MKHLLALAILTAPAVFAHSGEALKPHDLWSAWSFDPGIVIPLLLVAVLYFRGASATHGVTNGQKLYFWLNMSF
jgi:hypothetical protein